MIRVAVALLDPDEDEILPSHLPEDLFLADPVDDAKPSQQGPGPGMPPAVAATAGGLAALEPGARRLDQLEVELIERVMREVGGNLSAAARTLGVSRNRLYRKLGRAGARQAAGG